MHNVTYPQGIAESGVQDLNGEGYYTLNDNAGGSFVNCSCNLVSFTAFLLKTEPYAVGLQFFTLLIGTLQFQRMF